MVRQGRTPKPWGLLYEALSRPNAIQPPKVEEGKSNGNAHAADSFSCRAVALGWNLSAKTGTEGAGAHEVRMPAAWVLFSLGIIRGTPYPPVAVAPANWVDYRQGDSCGVPRKGVEGTPPKKVESPPPPPQNSKTSIICHLDNKNSGRPRLGFLQITM